MLQLSLQLVQLLGCLHNGDKRLIAGLLIGLDFASQIFDLISQTIVSLLHCQYLGGLLAAIIGQGLQILLQGLIPTDQGNSLVLQLA